MLYIIIDDFDIIIDYSKPVFCDIETEDLYGEIRTIQLFQAGNTYIIDLALATENVKQQCFVAMAEMHLVFHNASYDMFCLYSQTNRRMQKLPKKLDDTLYLSKLAYLDLQSYSLDRVAFACGCAYLYDDLDKKAMQKKGFAMDVELTQEQLRYAAADVEALSIIYSKLEPFTQKLVYKVDMLTMMYAMEFQKHGIPVHKSRVESLYRECLENIAKTQETLGTLNANSPKQVQEALGTRASDKKTLLHLIAQGNELAGAIFKQRRLVKRRGFFEAYNYDTVYTAYNVAGAVSGRFTATGKGIAQGINAQQIPREFKSLFVGPPGTVTMEADYSTLELRLAAAIYGDRVMAQQLIEGKDLHTIMAQQMTGRTEITKQERTKAKAVNFGFVYGMSASTFKEYAFENYGVEVSEEEAREIRNKYFGMYRDLAMYHKRIWHDYSQPGFVVKTALGRQVKPKLGTDALNIPIQGSGAECTKLGLHYFIKENPQAIHYVVNVVHDSIKLVVPKGEEDAWANKLRTAMLQGWEELNKSPLMIFKNIPINVDIEFYERTDNE